tara:strand:+ start:497 stop:1042 length:546 start_codon:yes stop_codon:yes gene_type:complete
LKKRYKTIFLDRDGTINFDPGYINKLKNFRFYDFTFDALKLFNDTGSNFCIITNQSGLARGLIKPSELDQINDFIKHSFKKNKLNLLDIYFCADHPDNPSKFRKPNTGMFDMAIKDHGVEIKNSLIIGDNLCDIQAGNRLGVDTMLVLTGKGQQVRSSKKIQPTYVAKNILVGAKSVLGIK